MLEVRLIRSDEYEHVLSIRKKVFVEEQNVDIDLEVDEFEQESEYFLGLVEGEPVTTGRIRKKYSYMKFERIATLKEHRGHGYAALLMKKMVDYSFSQHPAYLPAMHAQKEVMGFYQKLGWTPIGDVFIEADIEHRTMFYVPKDKQALAQLDALDDQRIKPEIREYLKSLL